MKLEIISVFPVTNTHSWVGIGHEVNEVDPDDCVVVVGQLLQQLNIKSNGSVICGHCTCMARQGETVSVILYLLETQFGYESRCLVHH